MKAAAVRFWAQRSARERRILAAAALLLLLVLCCLLLIEPALAGRTHWQAQLPILRAERAQMQVLARQATAAAPTARAAAPLDRAALERSLVSAGLKPQRLNAGDTLVRANFTDVSFSTLADWLQQSQRNAQLVVTEATFSARERMDRVDAVLSMRRPH